MKKYSFGKKIVLVSLVLVVLSINAFAGPRDHDGGFFLRLSIGIGGAETKFSSPYFPSKFSGASSDANIAIGACVFNNFALHATMFGVVMLEPTYELGDISNDFNGNVSLLSVGLGVTYYLMPANIYLSGSAGIGSLELEFVGVEVDSWVIESDPGPVFDLTLGKEWWVGGSWGLGVSGSFGYHSIKETNTEENWSGTSLAVRFSATRN